MRRGSASLGAAGWLRLFAAPTFSLMALLTLFADDGKAMPICTQAGEPALLSGMAAMYLLMAIFHLAPWLQLVTETRRVSPR